MTLALWVLGATVLVLGLTVVGGSVEENRGPLPDWDKSRAWLQEEGQRDEAPGIAEPAPPLQAEQDETKPPLHEEGTTPPTPPLQAQQDETALALQGSEMAPPLQEGEIAPPLQEENETWPPLQAEAAPPLQEVNETALALQQEEAASALQAEEVAPPSTTDSLDGWGEGVGGSTSAEPATEPSTDHVVVETATLNAQQATPVSQADEHEGENDRGCEQQLAEPANRAVGQANDRATERTNYLIIQEINQVTGQPVSVVIRIAAGESSTADQEACVQRGKETDEDQSPAIRILRRVLLGIS